LNFLVQFSKNRSRRMFPMILLVNLRVSFSYKYHVITVILRSLFFLFFAAAGQKIINFTQNVDNSGCE